MDILGGLLGGLGGRGTAPAPVMRGSQMPFKTHLVITDGDADYDTEAEVVAIIGALAAGAVSTLIWQMTVPAQQQIRFGFGSPNQPMNQGYLWFVSLDEAAGFQTGVLRLVQANARQTKVLTVLEVEDSRLHGVDFTTMETATLIDKNDMIALPEKVEFPRVGEDSLLQLWYRCIAVPAAEDACGFSVPCTVYQ